MLRQGPGLRQDAGDQLLDRGLAVAAGNTDQRQAEAFTPGMGAAGQRRQSISDQDLAGDTAARGAHHGTHRTTQQRRGHVVLAIEARTGQRHEQFTGVDGARVGRHAAERGIRADQSAIAALRKVGERRVHEAPASAARAPAHR